MTAVDKWLIDVGGGWGAETWLKAVLTWRLVMVRTVAVAWHRCSIKSMVQSTAECAHIRPLATEYIP